MTPTQLPPLPEPDTHCFDDDTGKDVWSYSADQMHAYALAALAQQAQDPVAWLYVDTVGERYLCFSRPTGGGAITDLYATPPAPQVPAPVDEQAEFKAELARMPEWEPDFKHHRAWVEPLLWSFWQARAALQSPAPQAGGWLPIESAPKDGTRLILWWGGKPVFAGWLDNSQCKHPWAGWQTPSLTPRPQGEPTHYMPPPPAPQTKGQP